MSEEKTKRELELELENRELKEALKVARLEEEYAQDLYMWFVHNKIDLETCFGTVGRLIGKLVQDSFNALINMAKANAMAEEKKVDVEENQEA